MASIMRSFARVPRARFAPSFTSAQPRRYAHSSYGNAQGGQEQGIHENNPKSGLEHPGPEAPASKNGSLNSSSGSSSTPSKSSESSDGSKPKISAESSSESQSADVKKHNEEMKQREGRSDNQLEEEDSKVDKKFWKGDVGDMSQNKSDDSK